MTRRTLSARAAVGLVALVVLVVSLAVLGFVTSLGAAEIGLVAVLATLAVGSTLLAIAAAIHALTREDLRGPQRLAWMGVSVLVPFGGVAYFLLGRARTREIFRDLGAAHG